MISFDSSPQEVIDWIKEHVDDYCVSCIRDLKEMPLTEWAVEYRNYIIDYLTPDQIPQDVWDDIKVVDPDFFYHYRGKKP